MEDHNSDYLVQVGRALKQFGFKTQKNKNIYVMGELSAIWPRNRKNYLFILKDVFTLNDSEDFMFKSTIKYCNENNIRPVVLTWVLDKELSDYTEDKCKKDFKIISMNRFFDLHREFLEVGGLQILKAIN